MTHDVPWTDGRWTNEPADVTTGSDGLHVTAREGSDAWRLTSYGFIHSSEHALLTTMEPESALEVQFRLDFAEQFDQAGLFVKVDDESWIKAGRRAERRRGEPRRCRHQGLIGLVARPPCRPGRGGW